MIDVIDVTIGIEIVTEIDAGVDAEVAMNVMSVVKEVILPEIVDTDVDLVEIVWIEIEVEIVIVEEAETDVIHEVIQDVIQEAIQEVHQEENIQDILDVTVDHQLNVIENQMIVDQEQDPQKEEQADHQEVEIVDLQKMVAKKANRQETLMEMDVLIVNHQDTAVVVDHQASEKNVLTVILMAIQMVVLRWITVIMNKLSCASYYNNFIYSYPNSSV